MRADKVEYSRQKRRALGCRGANAEIFAAAHESASGTKQTSKYCPPMSAFGGKADMPPHYRRVRF
jgi:hypothetical protein